MFHRPSPSAAILSVIALGLLALFSPIAQAADDHPRPYDPTRNAMADVDAALALAANSGKPALLVLGGNWCHDSRGLAYKFEQEGLSQIVQNDFHLVYVDVGVRNRNLDVAERFGVNELRGTPTVLIVSPQGALLNADTVHSWRTAYSLELSDVTDYFAAFARGDVASAPPGAPE